MNTQKSVLFVVLNFNGWQETLNCIDSLLAQSYSKFHILLIDNGSADDSLKKLDHFNGHDKITFIKNPINDGFAGGVNIGIRYAIEHGFPLISLINNDAFLSTDWLTILVDTLNKKKVSCATGLLLTSDKKYIESTADSYSRWGIPFPRQRGEAADTAAESGFVFGGTAGASLYKTSLFEDIGLFDDTFFAYFEDTDISYRAQLAGHTVYYEKNAVAYHDHGTTSNKIPGFTVQQTFKNLPLFFWKNIPTAFLLPTGIRFFLYFFLIYIRAIARGQMKVATMGLVMGAQLLPHAFTERRRIQRTRRVSLSYLNEITYPHIPPANIKKLHSIFSNRK